MKSILIEAVVVLEVSTSLTLGIEVGDAEVLTKVSST